ncbi:MAG: hypothetical protein ACSHXF_16335 [Aquaticitalea sp.]
MKTTEIRYYPTDFQFPLENFEIIGLDTTELNFRQLTNNVMNNGFDSDFGNVMVEFDDGKVKKRIMPYFYGNGLFSGKNILKIKSDSLLIDNNYPISDLKRILKRHYLNKGKIPYYSASPQKAIVEITIDTNKTGKELKEVLTKLTRTFDEIKVEIKDSIELRVFFDYFRQMPLPPPPPKTDEENYSK